MGFPHEWDPIAAGDTCSITPPPGLMVVVLGDDGEARSVSCWHMPHKVRAPYEKWGSGYACVECIEVYGD